MGQMNYEGDQDMPLEDWREAEKSEKRSLLTVGIFSVYYAVAAVVVVLWLLNALLCVGLWRIPKLHNTMKIKPSLGEKGKHPAQAKVVSTSHCPRSKRHRRLRSHQEPKKTDSTIATVTVYIGRGGGAGGGPAEGVKVIQNTAEIAVTGADIVSESLESEETHSKPTRVSDLESRSTVLSISHSGSSCKVKERCSCEKYRHANASPLAVYDLGDRSSLPTEVENFLSCQGGHFCFHDHERCRIVENKLYIYARTGQSYGNGEKRRYLPGKIPKLRHSSKHHRRLKRVTFSPVSKSRQSSKERESQPEAVSIGTHVSPPDDVAQLVPPPPHGYHVRVDPSSPDSSSEVLAADDSTWTQTDQDSETTNNHFGSPHLCHKQPHKRHRLLKKESDRTGFCSTPRRHNGSLRRKTKNRGLDSGRALSNKNTKPRYNNKICEFNSCGAFGDSLFGIDHGLLKEQSTSQTKIDNVGRNSDSNNGLSLKSSKLLREAMRPGVSRHTKSNKICSRHASRDSRNANNNKTNGYNLPVLLKRRARRIVSRSKQNMSANRVSNLTALSHLNTNMNACSDTEEVPKGVPEGEQGENSAQASNPSSGDQFYTPALGSPEHRLSINREEKLSPHSAANLSSEQCDAVELTFPGSQSSALESPTCLVEDIKNKTEGLESEQECWEAKKHNIVVACSEAIQSRLERQDLEEEESRDVTTSDSASMKQSSEGRKRRKTKTRESVYLKFKTSLSKKMTTTTTLKQVKQPLHGSATKSLVVESDHQNALYLSSQSSEQSMPISQPRHTRIIKCGDMEMPLRKRKLSSDTEVELMHSNDLNKKKATIAKAEKDSAARDYQISKKENTYLEYSNKEEYSAEVDRQDVTSVSQRSPQQYPSIGNGEIIGEWDKLSEKASAITVINVNEISLASDRKDQLSSSPNPDQRDSESKVNDENYQKPSIGRSLKRQSGSATVQTPKGKERFKRRSKSQTPRNGNSKRESEPEKEVTTEPVDAAEPPAKKNVHQERNSETSLSQESKKVVHTSSSSKATGKCKRSHSSPPECRKKKSLRKKKGDTPSVEPSDGCSSRSHKGRRATLDKRKKQAASALQKGRPRNTGSTTSSSSEKKKRSQTTASSISIDSLEERHQAVEQSTPKQEKTPSNRETVIPTALVSDAETSQTNETCEAVSGSDLLSLKQMSRKVKSRKRKSQKSGCQKEEAKHMEKKEVSEDPELQPVPQNSECTENEGTPEMLAVPTKSDPVSSKPEEKVVPKVAQAKIPLRSRAGEKDLQKAELGWNNSLFYGGKDKTKVIREKIKVPTRRHKLKYVLVKAKDKTVEKDLKQEQAQPLTERANPPEAATDQEAIGEGQKDSSQRSQIKTVQFSESIDKIENVKKAENVEEVESLEDHAQVNHTGDNASDGSLGDLFLTDNFDLVKDLVVETGEGKQLEPELEPEREKQSSDLPRRHKRPVWLKKKSAVKSSEEPVGEAAIVATKTNLSPKRLDKKKDSFEMLKSKKCNIQVTYPLQNAGSSPLGESTNLKTKVKYNSLLSDIFLSLPLKKTAKRVIAQTGTPVDIKEVTEGSSVDAGDYGKPLRYSPTLKRTQAIVPVGSQGLGAKRKRVSSEQRGVFKIRSSKELLAESGSCRSLLSRDSEAEGRMVSPKMSVSTDLDEATVVKQRPIKSTSNSRSLRKTARKKVRHEFYLHSDNCTAFEKQAAPDLAMIRRGQDGGVMAWHHLMRRDSSQYQDALSLGDHPRPHLSYIQMARDMVDTGVLSLGLAWVVQELTNRLCFLNPRRRQRDPTHQPSAEHSLETAALEQTLRAS
ncbi:mlck protein [Plakobranchus ocellatus]|uniref:Mlck protein n=1 Tax=Plakobranchus ocellatus TaxID=259542 RepID=A0AAV3Y0K7_9GAST|nr:mlck protein [Plakobranchus ocellatus]